MQKRELLAPFVPKLKHDTDVTYFDAEFTETPLYSPEGSKVGESYKGSEFGY